MIGVPWYVEVLAMVGAGAVGGMIAIGIVALIEWIEERR